MITLRSEVGRELTADEVDANFNELKKALIVRVEDTGKAIYVPDMPAAEGSFAYTLDQNSVVDTPTSVIRGGHGIIVIFQNATGGHVCTFDQRAYWKVDGWSVLDTSPNSMSLIGYDIGDDDIVFLRLIYSGINPKDIV